MEAKTKKRIITWSLIGVGVIVFYKIATKSNLLKFTFSTNSKKTIPLTNATNTNPGIIKENVNPFVEIGHVALTNKNNVDLRLTPGTYDQQPWYLFGVETPNTDHVVSLAGTNVGTITGVYQDQNGDYAHQWFKLDSTASSLFQKDNNLYVRDDDITFS